VNDTPASSASKDQEKRTGGKVKEENLPVPF